MALRWTMEALWTAIAVVVTTGGSIATTIYHAGQTQNQIVEIRSKQADTDKHVAKHDDQLDAIGKQNARIEQKLDDVSATVHDMQDHGVKRK